MVKMVPNIVCNNYLAKKSHNFEWLTDKLNKHIFWWMFSKFKKGLILANIISHWFWVATKLFIALNIPIRKHLHSKSFFNKMPATEIVAAFAILSGTGLGYLVWHDITNPIGVMSPKVADTLDDMTPIGLCHDTQGSQGMCRRVR